MHCLLLTLYGFYKTVGDFLRQTQTAQYRNKVTKLSHYTGLSNKRVAIWEAHTLEEIRRAHNK